MASAAALGGGARRERMAAYLREDLPARSLHAEQSLLAKYALGLQSDNMLRAQGAARRQLCQQLRARARAARKAAERRGEGAERQRQPHAPHAQQQQQEQERERPRLARKKRKKKRKDRLVKDAEASAAAAKAELSLSLKRRKANAEFLAGANEQLLKWRSPRRPMRGPAAAHAPSLRSLRVRAGLSDRVSHASPLRAPGAASPPGSPAALRGGRESVSGDWSGSVPESPGPRPPGEVGGMVVDGTSLVVVSGSSSSSCSSSSNNNNNSKSPVTSPSAIKAAASVALGGKAAAAHGLSALALALPAGASAVGASAQGAGLSVPDVVLFLSPYSSQAEKRVNARLAELQQPLAAVSFFRQVEQVEEEQREERRTTLQDRRASGLCRLDTNRRAVALSAESYAAMVAAKRAELLRRMETEVIKARLRKIVLEEARARSALELEQDLQSEGVKAELRRRRAAGATMWLRTAWLAVAARRLGEVCETLQQRKRLRGFAVVIQRRARVWLARRYARALRAAVTTLRSFVVRMVVWRRPLRRARAGRLLGQFLLDNRKNFLQVVRDWRRSLIKCQLAVRQFVECTHARVLALSKTWARLEKRLVKQAHREHRRRLDAAAALRTDAEEHQPKSTIEFYKKLARNLARGVPVPAMLLPTSPAEERKAHKLAPAPLAARFPALRRLVAEARSRHRERLAELKRDSLKVTVDVSGAMRLLSEGASAASSKDVLPDLTSALLPQKRSRPSVLLYSTLRSEELFKAVQAVHVGLAKTPSMRNIVEELRYEHDDDDDAKLAKGPTTGPAAQRPRE
jgi:hypothetical protein